MGNQIIRQPNGLFAVFSTETDTIRMHDATADEVVEAFAEDAAERARENVRRAIGHVTAGNPRKAYFQFAMSWEEALGKDRQHGGEAWKSFRG